MNNKQIANEIIKLARLYADNLAGRNVIFVYQDTSKRNTINCIETVYYPKNFLHLTGVHINKNRLTAVEFYKKALSGSLLESDFSQSPNPHRKATKSEMDLIEDKIKAAKTTLAIHKSAKMLGDWNGNGYMFQTERIVGTEYACLCYVADEKNHALYRPNSNQLADIRDNVKKTNPILVILRKNAGAALYDEITHIGKKISLDELKLPPNILEKLTDFAKEELKQPVYKENGKQEAEAKDVDDSYVLELDEDDYVLELDEDEEPETGKETGDDIEIDDDDELDI